MKKKIGIGAIALFLVLFLSTQIAPATTGKVVYGWATEFEAGVYGLEPAAVDIGEMTIHLYKNEFDEGRPTILMLHGYSADKDVWTRFAKHFTDDFNVIVPDMAGHGDTGFNEKWSYKMVSQAQRMISLLDKLEIKSAHVIGNSMGGFIAAHMGRLFPERVITSTLVDPAGVVSPLKSDMEKMLAEGRNPFEIDSREQFDEFFPMTMAKPPYFPDFLLEAVSEKYQVRKPELIHIFKDFFGQEMLDDQLQDIKVPVLLMWGDLDRIIHVSAVDVWKKGVPNIEVKVWKDIGHMPMMEIASESAEYYLGFLAKY